MLGRRQRRGVLSVVIGLAAVLALAACGGGSSKPSSSPTTVGDGGGAVTTTSAGGSGGSNGSCFTDPGPQHAKVRFVNLFTNATYPSSDIDVWQGFSGTDPCGKKLATIPYGTASDYVDVTAADTTGNWEATGYIAGSTAEDHTIISQSETWKGGEQVTIIFQGQDPTAGNGPSAGGDQTIYESQSDINHDLDAVPGKALVAIGAASTEYVVKDGSWVAGTGGTCFTAKGDTAGTRTNIGGTSLVPYPVAPGSLSVGLFKSDPGTCTGTPDIGPVTVDATAGSRTMVLAYGATPSTVKLLVLPIAS